MGYNETNSVVCIKCFYKRGPETAEMGTLSWNHYFKYNISSSNQSITINEAPLDSRGFLNKNIAYFLEFVENRCHYEYLNIFFLKI